MKKILNAFVLCLLLSAGGCATKYSTAGDFCDVYQRVDVVNPILEQMPDVYYPILANELYYYDHCR